LYNPRGVLNKRAGQAKIAQIPGSRKFAPCPGKRWNRQGVSVEWGGAPVNVNDPARTARRTG